MGDIFAKFMKEVAPFVGALVASLIVYASSDSTPKK